MVETQIASVGAGSKGHRRERSGRQADHESRHRGEHARGKRRKLTHDECRLMEALRQVRTHAVQGRQERQDEACESKPGTGPHERRAQLTDWRRALDQCIDQFRVFVTAYRSAVAASCAGS
jgi:hypothetical protein